LGQNFIIDRALIKRMVEKAEIGKNEVVVDVGAGFGFLTEEIARKAGKVIAIEIDPKIVEVLSTRLRNFENVEVIHGDFLKLSIPKFDKVVSTPPYSISSPFIFRLLRYDFDKAVLTFQEEFARRLAALPGTDDYGRLTIMTYYNANVELLETVHKTAFYPSPEVNSILVQIRPREPPFQVPDEEFFSKMVFWLFTQRNRTIKNGLSVFLEKIGLKAKAEDLIKELSFARKRVFQLTPEELGLLCTTVYYRL